MTPKTKSRLQVYYSTTGWKTIPDYYKKGTIKLYKEYRQMMPGETLRVIKGKTVVRQHIGTRKPRRKLK